VIRIMLPLRTYTVTDGYVELLNLVLSFVMCLNNIGIESLNNFISLVHHICFTTKYNVPYVRVSPKGLSPQGLSANEVLLKSSRRPRNLSITL
jgi:hypothetical protein